jgi:GNAT superfamily N-acetyltransferase
MKIVDVAGQTESIFLRCMNPKEDADSHEVDIRRRWYEKHRDKGHRAKLLLEDDGQAVGLCQYAPIEHSHLAGEDLLAILCIWVHSYDRHPGNKQGKGYGRFLLGAFEDDARRSGAKGVAAWGLDWDIWMPVSFYEHMGYVPADREDKVVVVWKPFSDDAKPPRLRRLRIAPPRGTDRINVTVAANGWCGCYKYVCAREAIKGIEHMVDYAEIDTPDRATILHLGTVGGIFLDGEVFQPYQVCDTEGLRSEIIRLYELKQTSKS